MKTTARHLKGIVKLRHPIAYKVEDRYLWYMSGKCPKWIRGWYIHNDVKEVGIRNQKFGANAVSFYKKLGLKGHNGLDWYAPTGTTAFAVQDGRIGYVNNPATEGYNTGYGGFVELLFGNYRYIYAHLDKVYVRGGQRIFAGQPIGNCDNTGKYTTGSHLHTGFMELDEQGNRLNTDNGYIGYIDDSMLYIEPDDTVDELEDLEKMYWYAIEKGKVNYYYGFFGSLRWTMAKKHLGVSSNIDRGDFYDFSRSHKLTK